MIILIAFLSGVLIFVAAMIIFNGKLSAIKRKKTKLGLVKVAGVGLKFDKGEAGDSGRPVGVAGTVEGVEAGVAAAGVDADAGLGPEADDDVAGAAADVVGGVADGQPADGALSDDPPVDDANSEYEETLAFPIEAIDVGDDTDAGAEASAPPPKQPDGGANKRDNGVAVSGAHKAGIGIGGVTGSVVRPIDKTVDRASDNPFANGKLFATQSSSAKKALAPIKRRRLPETVKMKDRKVILAEDVAINRELIAMYFDGSGVKFEFAVNGREVCEKFERDPSAYSLILMDIQMPEMDGYEVSRKIRAMDVDWAKQIPIIAMTGNDQKEDIDLCFDAGMDDHIAKPIDMEVLQEKVFDIITLSAESF